MSTALLSHGATVTWGGTPLTNITRVTVGGGSSENQEGGGEVSIAHLGSCHCKEEPFLKTWAAPAGEGDANSQIQVDFMGTASFTKDQIASFALSGPASFSFTDCTCVSVQTTASVGDVLRGSATIRFA
jgi:hypothetical protein